ncbi:unnamed protein product [Acanthoscelides obtectus]|uniref:THAP-type domain-containing protein n=1 Tax=Acanthoscelides obtectus TaxID=200917 RepID=A0A9P0LV58_ACAOB|nr:unnamed protein product [Acanthoscelides obtectus]CAK1657410.1 52 kDa repressor of the inhibitor of the protein kinase [Acanthoscelides obtectus]
MYSTAPSGISRCAAKFCTNNSNNCQYSFFKFPTDTGRSNVWLLACGRKDLMGKENLYKSSYKMCGFHFESHMFANDTRNRLRKNAFPTIFPTLAELIPSSQKELRGLPPLVPLGRTKNTAGNASDPSSSFIENSLSTTNSGEKLQSEDPFGATPLQGPSTTISNTNDIPEFDEPESIKIEPIQIKREYYEDESEAPSNKRFCFDDDLSAFGRLVEQKLRMMPTEYGKRLVMQKIEAILHEAESGVYDYPKSDSELPEQCPPFVAVEACVKQEVEES